MVKTIIVSGFLGAGKTTVLRRLLTHYCIPGRKTAVMINEFGKIGIDGAVVGDGPYEKIELNRGSIFCVCMRADFISEVKRICTDLRPDVLLIEPTGIARTDDLYAMLSPEILGQHLHVIQNICVIDAQNFLKVSRTLEAVRIQVSLADLLVLNKTDKISADQKAAIYNELRVIRQADEKELAVTETVYGEIPVSLFPELDKDQESSENRYVENTGDTDKHKIFSLSEAPDNAFYSYSTVIPQSTRMHTVKWHAFISAHCNKISRAKGLVPLETGVRFFEIINGQYSDTAKIPPGLIAANPEGYPMVFIQPHESFEEIKAALNSF